MQLRDGGVRVVDRWRYLARCLMVALLCSNGTAWAEDQKTNDSLDAYRLNSGDKISITVFDEEDLSIEVAISDMGAISYPFIGEIKVKGMTPVELEELVTRELKGPYLVDPKVRVSILAYRPFYIHGEVKESGGYPYQPGLTLRRAITLAGGLTERASKNKITVIRDTDKQKRSMKIGMDDLVYPGDTITIEQGLF